MADKKVLILGGLAVASTTAYLYFRSKNDNKSINEAIDGVSIDIRPEALVDGMGSLVKMNPRFKEPLLDITKQFVSRAVAAKGPYEN